jgi:hypothetical protein
MTSRALVSLLFLVTPFSLARLPADCPLALALSTFFIASAPESSPAADSMIRVFTASTGVAMIAATELAFLALIAVISAVSFKDYVAIPFCYRIILDRPPRVLKY